MKQNKQYFLTPVAGVSSQKSSFFQKKLTPKVVLKQNNMTVREFDQFTQAQRIVNACLRKAGQRTTQQRKMEREQKWKPGDFTRWDAEVAQMVCHKKEKLKAQMKGQVFGIKKTAEEIREVARTVIDSGLIEKLATAADSIENLPDNIVNSIKAESANIVVEVGLTVSRLIVSPTLPIVAIEVISLINKFTNFIPSMMEFITKQVMWFFTWGMEKVRTTMQERKRGRSELHAQMLDMTSIVDNWASAIPYGAGLAALLGSALLGRHVTGRQEACTAFSRWARFGGDLSKFRSGIKTVFEFVNYVMDEVKSFIYGKFPSLGVKSSTVQHFKSRYDFDVKEFVKEVHELTDPLARERVLASHTTRIDLEKLIKQASIISIDVANGDVVPSAAVSAQLRDVKQRLLKFADTYDALDSSNATRFTPFVVAMFGEPGCGKSVACDLLAKTISDPRWCTVPLDHENLIYARSSADKYWSLYNNQSIIVLDDFGQKNGSTPNESEFIEFINMVSAVQWSVPMAAVEDKGKRFRGKAVILTTNTPFPCPNEVLCKEAIWRRRNVLVQVTKRDPFKDGLPNPLIDCTFTLRDPLRPEENSAILAELRDGTMKKMENLSFKEMCEYIVPKFNSFWEEYVNSEAVKDVPELNMFAFKAQMSGMNHQNPVRNEEPCPRESFEHLVHVDVPTFETEDLWERYSPDEEHLPYVRYHYPKGWWCCADSAPESWKQVIGVTYCCKLERFVNERCEIIPLVRSEPFDHLYYVEWLTAKVYARMGKYNFNDGNTKNPFFYIAHQYHHIRGEEVPLVAYQNLYDYHLWQFLYHQDDPLDWHALRAQMKPSSSRKVAPERPPPPMWEDIVSSPEAFIEAAQEEERDLLLNFEATEVSKESTTSFKVVDGGQPKSSPAVQKALKALKVVGAIGVALATAGAGYGLKQLLFSGKKAQVGPDGKILEKTIQAYPEGVREHVAEFLIDMAGQATTAILTKKLLGEGGSKGSGDHRTMYATKKPIRVVKPEMSVGGQVQEWAAMLSAEGTRDKNCVDFTRMKLPKNLVKFTGLANGRTVSICGLALKDRAVLLPFHFVNCFKKQSAPIIVQTIFDEFREDIDFGKAKRIVANGFAQDLAIIQLSMRVPSFPSIMDNFVDEKDMEKLIRTEGMLARIGNVKGVRMALEMTNLNVVAETEMTQSYECGDDQYELLKSFSYLGNTQEGDCGAALIAVNEHTRGKIFGIHIAGNDNGLGVSVPVHRKMIEVALSDLRAQQLTGREIPQILQDLTPEEIDAKAAIRPSGTIKIAGIVEPFYGQRLPEKTDIKPSLIHGMVTKPTTQPAVLKPSDPRMDEELRKAGHSPMEAGINKYSTPTNPFPQRDLEIAKNVISAKLKGYMPSGMTRRLLTTKEAINGVPTANFVRLNMGTSPGMPYKAYRAPDFKGKHHLFRVVDTEGEEVIYDFDTNYEYKGVKAGALLKENYEKNEALIRQGIIPDWYYYSNLKQERRKMAKIRAGATRTFECAPLDQTLLYRKYFGAFIATMNQNCAELPSSVGIDPEGPNWTVLYNRLKKFGGKVLAGDFKEWDGKLPGDVMETALEIINAWYGDGQEEQNARRVLIETAIHAFVLCRDVLCLKMQGIPSGIPLTADLNGLCNWIYSICALLELARRNDFQIVAEEILKLFEAAYYGDDHVVAPHPAIQHFFTFHNVRDFFREKGIVYTDALKTGQDPLPLEPITQVTYLKRRFVPNEEFPDKIMAPIEMETIDEEINWIRESADDLEATLQNIYAAKLHLLQHGRTVFEQKLSMINAAICAKRDEDLQFSKTSRWEEVPIDYDNELFNWLKKFY